MLAAHSRGMSILDTVSNMGVGRILFGLLVVMLVGILVYVMAGSPGLSSATRTASSQSLVFWKSPDPQVALRIDTSEVGAGMSFTRYTMLVEMIWYNTRVIRQAEGENPYRHILHRGSPEVASFAVNTPLLGDSISDVDRQAVDTTNALDIIPQGLPTRMNPGIMADPYTNDMLLFFDTENGVSYYRESVRIPDIPMDQPFQLGIVVIDRYVEIYLNCSLEVTKMLEGIPRDVGREWFGLSGPVPLPAQVQNLRLFNDIVSHKTLQTYCGTIPVFKGPKPCNTARV